MDGAMETVAESWKVDPTYNKISDFLGLDIYDRQNYKTYQKIEKIKEYAQQKGEHPTQIMNEMYRLKKSIGTWRVGEDLVNELFQNVRIKEATNKFNAEKKIVSNGEVKEIKKSEAPSPIKKVIAQGVNQVVAKTLNEMVKKTLMDKKIIQGAVEQSVREALK